MSPAMIAAPTTELQKAVSMLFSAQQDGDPFRIRAAMRHLEFLNGIARLRACEGEPQDVVALFERLGNDDEPEPDADSFAERSSSKTDTTEGAARV